MPVANQLGKLNQKAKLELVETSLREWRNPISIAPALPAHELEALVTLQRNMRQSRDAHIEKAEAHKRFSHAYRQAKRRLKLRIRHALQLVKRQVALEPDIPRSIICAFGLRANGSYPVALQKLPQPIQTARDIIKAEQAANTQGYTILTDPSADELESHIENVEHLEAQRSSAQSEEVLSRDYVTEAVQQWDDIIGRIRRYLDYALYGRSKSEKHQVLEALGFPYQTQTRSNETT